MGLLPQGGGRGAAMIGYGFRVQGVGLNHADAHEQCFSCPLESLVNHRINDQCKFYLIQLEISGTHCGGLAYRED